MNIVITGASGLIGTALSSALRADGHQVYGMQRSPSSDAPFHWWPPAGHIHFDDSIPVDVVINLAGAGIADRRWNERRKQEIRDSRVLSTELLAKTLSRLPHRPGLFISGSAIGFYGDTGAERVDEMNEAGSDFLAEVSYAWEQAAKPALDAGIRTVLIRTGIVLSDRGGALQKMLLPFKLGVGGVVGSGQQYMSWVSLRDVVAMIRFLMAHEELSGPVNLVAPTAVTNREFTRTLGSALKRPALLPMPAFAARLAFGEMADQLLLSSIRVYPYLLQQAGYRFQDGDLETALANII